jgi:hypothetical protein
LDVFRRVGVLDVQQIVSPGSATAEVLVVSHVFEHALSAVTVLDGTYLPDGPKTLHASGYGQVPHLEVARA